ncbi:hypothetical protein CHUAL_010834 [Chamberlinius hualienensis]
MASVNEKMLLHKEYQNIAIEKLDQPLKPYVVKNSRTPGRVSKDIDGGWAWVVCAVSFSMNLLFNGQIASSSVFFVAFQQAFQQSRSTISWIFGIQNAAVCVGGPLASLLVRKWGPRSISICGCLLMAGSMIICYFANSVIYLTVFFGLCGVGGSCVFTSSVAALAIYFKARLYVATGIAIAGAGLGIIVLTPLLEWTMDVYGWRGALLLHGGVLLQGVVCGALIFTPRRSKAESLCTNNSNQPSSDRVLLLDIRTWLIVLCIVFHFLNFPSFLLCLKDFLVREKPIGVSFSAIALVAGVANAFARVISGLLAKLVVPSVLFTIASFLAAAFIAPLVLITSDWMIIVSVGIINFGFGLQSVVMNLMTAYMFGGKEMGTIFSYGLFASVFGVLPAPLLIGYVKDTTGSYAYPFITMAALLFLAGLCSLAAFCVHRNVSTNKVESQNQIS